MDGPLCLSGLLRNQGTMDIKLTLASIQVATSLGLKFDTSSPTLLKYSLNSFL